MRRTRWLICLISAAFSGHLFAQTSTSVVEQLQLQRQKFSQDEKVDLQQLSHDIQAAVKDSDALDRAGKDTEAINRLSDLEKYAPLGQFPDYNVQALCSNIYGKLNKQDQSRDCRERAHAMAEILEKRSGSGTTPDDPVRVIRIDEITQWINLRSAMPTDVKGIRYHDTELQKVTYSIRAADGQPAVSYFLINPRVFASTNRTGSSAFDPLPVKASDGKYFVALQQAHEQRVKFLSDRSFNYLELMQLCRDSEKQAIQLAQQGDINGALSKIREVEKIRPIREIPLFSLISNYSMLLGKAGDVDAQADMRLYLFGITQDIARSGDGLSPETAIHVIATDEEYSWLHAKKLRLTRQTLMPQGTSQYDALDTVDASGKTQTFYFDVGQIVDRGNPALNP
ncbi:hypothetical protein BWP39_13015 [Paraburkholderia acidicola]|uniref:DUF4919 domain-containing protein n=1 Tax=Paraburkholderia acidicola TaxID=1912599 RepID=A0A2A4EYB8_9BURK|nr:hypothetical protein BWP39_13015 [Paraburkholderia acidicola]